MAFTESLRALLGTLGAMAQTRLELAALEIEEESQRLLAYLVMALASLLLFGIALLMLALLVIIVCWDHYRIEATIGMVLLFGLAGTFTAFKLRNNFRTRPPLMGATIAEINKDINVIKYARQGDE